MATRSTPVAISFDGTTEDSKLAQDHKREVDQRRKYSLGTMDTGARIVPIAPEKQRVRRKDKMYSQRAHRAAAAQSKNIGKHPTLVPDSDAVVSDSSAEESTREASAAPEPDAGIAYSFDAKRGPSHGSEILSMAINKAVERYENKATERLVKDEYEVVAHELENQNEGYVADEDDFELV